MRVEWIGHFKPCMTDIYLHIRIFGGAHLEVDGLLALVVLWAVAHHEIGVSAASVRRDAFDKATLPLVRACRPDANLLALRKLVRSHDP